MQIFLFSVAPIPAGNKWEEYYILHNGTDVGSCGESVEKACGSLEYVLLQYYKKPPDKGLKVITDKSIIIGHTTMVSQNSFFLIFHWQKILQLLFAGSMFVLSNIKT